MHKQILSLFTLFFITSCGGGTGSVISIEGVSSQITTSVTNSATDRGEFAATSGIDPDIVELKVRKIALSTNADCSNLTTVFETDEPEYLDFKQGVSIGQGNLANGTYNCVVIEMSDQVRFSPETDSDTSCDASETYTMDVCQPQGENYLPTFQLVDGTTGDCTAAEDYVGIWISTISEALPRDPGEEGEEGDEGFPYIPATTSTPENGFKLQGALVIDGATTMNFITDFTNRVAEEGDDDCGMESPNWGFQEAE